jgi:ketosteroid isomerase-like protein
MIRFTLLLTLVLAAVLVTVPRAAAQEATPVPACNVDPRPEEELIAMNASPSPVAESTALATTPMEMPEGDSPDAATLNALDETLQQAVACAEAGDIGRLLALYSDEYVANVALAPEPIPIIPGQVDDHDHAPTLDETPVPTAGVAPRVETAVQMPDGRIAATVSAEGLEGTEQIVIFTEERGMWVIDEIHTVLPEGPVGGDLPFAVQAAVAAAAAAEGIDPTSVTVVNYEPTEWPDTSLGCPKEGEVYAQVITPGYLVILSVDGIEMEYHTDDVDRAVRCDLE